MAERQISEAEVEEVLESYHTHYYDRRGHDILISQRGGRRIKVVVALGSAPPRIITVGD